MGVILTSITRIDAIAAGGGWDLEGGGELKNVGRRRRNLGTRKQNEGASICM
jgi:hypothetical protein